LINNTTMTRIKKKSRAGKKNQRKNTDISDVIQHREQEHKDSLEGGPVYKKKNEQLFFVDTMPANLSELAKFSSKYEYHKSREPVYQKSLKANPNIQPAAKSNNAPSMTAEQKRIESLAKKMKRKMEKESNQNSDNNTQHYDLWDPALEIAEKKKQQKIDDESHSWIAPFVEKKVIKKPNQPKPSFLPAVEVTAAGNSYRPTYEAHQDVIGVAVARALEDEEREKEEKEARRILNSRTRKMGMDIDNPEEETLEEEEEEEEERPPEFSERVTEKERKRRLRAKQNIRLQQFKLQQSRIEKQIAKLPELLSNIEERERLHKARYEVIAKTREWREKYMPKRIGPYKYHEPAPAVVLTEELPTHMRTVKPAGNLLQERMKSLHKRNMVEPRKKVKTWIKHPDKWVDKHNMDVEDAI